MSNTYRQSRSRGIKVPSLLSLDAALGQSVCSHAPLLPNSEASGLTKCSGNKENRLRRWPQRTELRFYMWQNISPRGVQTDRQTDGHSRDSRWGRGAKGWAVLSSNLLVEAVPHPRKGWGNIGTGGGETGMRCPSLRWAAGQGPVLVGTIGSLWTSCDAGEGQGCWTTGMPRLREPQG